MSEKCNITLFTGHYGSGKTELAINYSLKCAREGTHTVLVDLDIVNPFFRSSEIKSILENEKIEVISPVFATSNINLPALPASIFGLFDRKDCQIIFDVGGDEDGARALGRYFPYFQKHDYNMFFVINTLRPFTSNCEDIVTIIKEVEKSSRLKVEYLINNTNLSYETKPEMIMEGQKIIEEVSGKVNIPIQYISGTKNVLSQLDLKYMQKGFVLETFMKPPWDYI